MEENKITDEEKAELFGADPNKAQIIQQNSEEGQKLSLEEFDVVDGKHRDDKEMQIAQARELEDLLGIREMNPYKTLNREIFEENLESMSISDMTELATHVGVTPTLNSRELKKALKSSFQTYARKHNVTVPSQSKPIINKNSPNYKKNMKLFNDI
jgi:predicted subunit of tRNA(5-methylaminomethyl-2-thiouridylate) methyltransferase